MNEILQLFYYSGRAVATILLAAGAGALMVRFGMIKKDTLKLISQLVFAVMLPCLLFTKIAASIDLAMLREFWILPLSCVLYIGIGLSLGMLMRKFCRPRPEISSGAMVACGFANSGYLPIPLLMAATVILPCFSSMTNASDRAVALISVYLVGFSPLLWTLGFSMIFGKKPERIEFKRIFPPPVLGIFLGMIIGLTPFLRDFFCSRSGFAYPLFEAAAILAKGTVPCALLVLGGRLANGPVRGSVNRRTIFSVVAIKLLILPALALLYVAFLRHTGIIGPDLLIALVLVVEAASPPGNNLIIMASMARPEAEDGVATLLFWNYICSIFTLTVFIMLSVKFFA